MEPGPNVMHCEGGQLALRELFLSRTDASHSIAHSPRGRMIPGTGYTEQCMCSIRCLHSHRGSGKNHSSLDNTVEHIYLMSES